MSELAEHVSLTITADTLGIALAGFGVALIVSHSASWVERTRSYTDLAGVATDFAAGTPEYLSASALFSQSPHPERVMIGRASLKPTQVYVVSVASVQNSTAYAVDVAGDQVTATTISFTSDATATNDEIVAGLVSALNAVASKNYLAAATGSAGSQVCTVTGTIPAWLATTAYVVGNQVTNGANVYQCITAGTSAGSGGPTGTTSDITDGTVHWKFLRVGGSAGAWFALELVDINLLGVKQTHSDPGLATDLAAILVEDESWYALHTTFNSKAYVLAAAAWVESNKKLYLVDVNETDSVNTIVSGSTDTLGALFALSYNRTAGSYYSNPATMFSAAWMGRVLPDTPGSETWKFKTLSGVVAMKLTSTQRTNLRARKANSYTTIAGANKTWEGMVAGGSYGFIDITRGLDWLEDDMTKSVFAALSGPEKLPYTNAGIAVIRSVMKASLKRAVSNGVISDDFEIEMPKLAAISASDKALRKLKNVKFTATLQGAIHEIDLIGVVSV
jgi:hypothetical protein